MKWRPAPEELVNFITEAMQDIDCQKRKMFGYPAYFINGNMFVALHQESLILRLSGEERQRLMSQHPDVVPFEPMPGRTMKEYVVIPEALFRDDDRFSELLSMSMSYVASLPLKEKKKKRK